MAQHNILIHAPRKMRRVVRDTQTTDAGMESRYECPVCQSSAWRILDYSRVQTFMCNGDTVATVLPMPKLDLHPPGPEELTDLLREVLRSTDHNPNLRLRIIAMVRRLRSPL